MTAALSTARSCVPVVGDYFARAVAMVLGLLQWARNIKEERDAILRMAGAL